MRMLMLTLKIRPHDADAIQTHDAHALLAHMQFTNQPTKK